MEGIDERYLNVARQIRGRLSERYWTEVVDVSRTMTTDCVSLEDDSAVARFAGPRCSRSASKAVLPTYESKCTCDSKTKFGASRLSSAPVICNKSVSLTQHAADQV